MSDGWVWVEHLLLKSLSKGRLGNHNVGVPGTPMRRRSCQRNSTPTVSALALPMTFQFWSHPWASLETQLVSLHGGFWPFGLSHILAGPAECHLPGPYPSWGQDTQTLCGTETAVRGCNRGSICGRQTPMDIGLR